jgi:hypothetical protein
MGYSMDPFYHPQLKMTFHESDRGWDLTTDVADISVLPNLLTVYNFEGFLLDYHGLAMPKI